MGPSMLLSKGQCQALPLPLIGRTNGDKQSVCLRKSSAGMQTTVAKCPIPFLVGLMDQLHTPMGQACRAAAGMFAQNHTSLQRLDCKCPALPFLQKCCKCQAVSPHDLLCPFQLAATVRCDSRLVWVMLLQGGRHAVQVSLCCSGSPCLNAPERAPQHKCPCWPNAALAGWKKSPNACNARASGPTIICASAAS